MAKHRVSPAPLLTPNFRLSIHHLMVNFGATAGEEKVRRNHSGTKETLQRGEAHCGLAVQAQVGSPCVPAGLGGIL